MADPSVPGEKLLARNPPLRRLAVALFLAPALALAIGAAIWGDHWASHGIGGKHTQGTPSQPARL